MVGPMATSLTNWVQSPAIFCSNANPRNYFSHHKIPTVLSLSSTSLHCFSLHRIQAAKSHFSPKATVVVSSSVMLEKLEVLVLMNTTFPQPKMSQLHYLSFRDTAKQANVLWELKFSETIVESMLPDILPNMNLCHDQLTKDLNLNCLKQYRNKHDRISLFSDYSEEPATNVKFQKLISLPGCSSPLSLLGTGYREKVFAIIGVKVYAAGLYTNPSISSTLDPFKGHSAQEITQSSYLFDFIFQAPLEKSLQIVLVRDIDGKTFWDALDEAISPRIQSPTPVDESALSTFRVIFQGRPLKKGTFIFLTWLDQSKMLVSVASDGLPTAVDATIESTNVTSSLFNVFFGDNPVSPSLKTSVSEGLSLIIK